MVAGVNGAGKTTTCAKLAHRVQAAGLKPLLAAADTFRAAGADQLKLWAQRLDVDVVAGVQGADAAAVAYDGLDAAMARGSDVLILDTAGRMHTKAPLIEELRKTCRALAKCMPDAPHERWLVLDASMGQNALVQARVFHEAIDLTGVIVAKLDGSSKAGFLFAVQRELGVPILFAGLGEGQDDLIPFDPEAYVEALLDLEPAGEGQTP
jgi:fused signal recognition particle receptor